MQSQRASGRVLKGRGKRVRLKKGASKGRKKKRERKKAVRNSLEKSGLI